MVATLNEIEPLNDVERLILLRKRFNLSQFQLAKELGISSSYLGQIEREELPFNKQFKAKVNDYLKREKMLHEKDIFSTFTR
jgi:transcriptional regulator with XRE-family HTH domain